MIRWLRARRADERGFTLVELMMAIALTGVVIAPLAAGIVVGLRTGDEAYNRVAGSNAAQLLSVWLPPDLQSAGPNSDDVVGAPTPNTDCSGTQNLLRMKWRETQGVCVAESGKPLRGEVPLGSRHLLTRPTLRPVPNGRFNPRT